MADLIRDTFKRGKYQDVILPLTVLRRLDSVACRVRARRRKQPAEAAELVSRMRGHYRHYPVLVGETVDQPGEVGIVGEVGHEPLPRAPAE